MGRTDEGWQHRFQRGGESTKQKAKRLLIVTKKLGEVRWYSRKKAKIQKRRQLLLGIADQRLCNII